MNKYSPGYILIITLTTIMLVNLLLLTNMQFLLLYHKATNQTTSRHRYFYQLEEMALRIAKSNLTKEKKCLQKDEGANLALRRLLNRQGCAITNNQSGYQYTIEDLGEFPCLIIAETNTGSHQRRVSVLLVANEEHPASFLQLRYSNPSNSPPCQNLKRPIKSGVTSWRYIAVV